MFERFTDHARQAVLECAQAEAHVLTHDYLGTEHLLLGVLRVQEGLGAHALASVDITLEHARTEVANISASGKQVTSGRLRITNSAKKALELALREALEDDHNRVDTEHVLVGLLDGHDERTVGILAPSTAIQVLSGKR